ncbi:MAG: tRNA uridine-5-carboxymethylaminomethyl(34) synthesis GTPase MnmE [Pseudomonadales bacterium]
MSVQPAGEFEPIVAVATAPGMGGVGIVRISGSGAGAIGRQLFSRSLQHQNLRYGNILDANGDTVDQGMAVLFQAPASFTGETVVEFHGHGGPVVLAAVVGAAQACGARLARPGEFSERAFLNGKLDLAQAEAIADLISSSSAAAAKGALRSLQGAFSAEVDSIAEQVLWLRTYVEATLDFPDEEDVDHLTRGGVNERLVEYHAALEKLIQSTSQSVLLTEGVKVALVGAPNVGKSSLLNTLLAADRAIVSDIPGTTRDLLEADLVLEGLPITLIDTAGLRDSADPIEQEGVRRARQAASQVDLIVHVDSPDSDFNDRSVEDFLAANPDTPVLQVLNKVDLLNTAPQPSQGARLPVSATRQIGLSALVRGIHQSVGYGTDAAPFSARRRHLEALQLALEHARQALAMARANDGGVLLAEELRGSHEALGSIVGRVTADDLLGEIFGSFCIGK